MAFDKNTIQLEARLAAITIVLTKMFAMATQELSDADFERLIQSWSDGMDRETFDGDAATSALLSGEIRDQLLDLLHATREVRQQIAAGIAARG